MEHQRLRAYVRRIEKIIEEMMSPPVTKTKQRRRQRVDNLQTTRQLLHEAIDQLPCNLRDKGWNLVQYLDQNKLMLSSTGEFIPFATKEPIVGSHITNLIFYALRKQRNETEPNGWLAFHQQLQSYNIRPGILSKRHHINTAEPMDTTSVVSET